MADTPNSGPSRATNVKIVLAFLTIYLLWGLTFLGIRVAVETIPPFIMSGLRFVTAGGVMLLALLARGERFPSLLHWRSAAFVGGLMLLGGIGMLSFAEQRIPSGLAALVVATMPIWVTLIEWLGFGGGRPGLHTFVGLGLGVAGATLLFAPALRGERGSYDLLGMLIVLGAAISFATGSLYSRRMPLPENGLMSTAIEMLAGGVLLMLASLLTGEPARLNLAAVSTRSVLGLVYLIVLGSIVGYTVYLWLIRTVEPSRAATTFLVNPLVAVFAGWLVLNETVSPTMLVAAVVILLGVAVVNDWLPRIGPAQKAPSQAGSGTTD